MGDGCSWKSDDSEQLASGKSNRAQEIVNVESETIKDCSVQVTCCIIPYASKSSAILQ